MFRTRKLVNVMIGAVALVGVSLGSTLEANANPFTAAYDFQFLADGDSYFAYNGTPVPNVGFDQMSRQQLSNDDSRLDDSFINEWPTLDGIPPFDSSFIPFRHVEFTVVPDEGYEVALQNVSFDLVGIGNNAPQFAEWRSSLDMFATPIESYSSLNPSISQSGGVLTVPTSFPQGNPPAPVAGNVLDLSGPEFQSLTEPITFRLYMYGAEERRNQAGLHDEVVINGEVKAASSSSPPLIQSPTLDQYSTLSIRAIPNTAEASGIAYDRDQDALFVIDDEGILDVYSRRGELLQQYGQIMDEDLEGITYLGNGQFLVAEERDQNAFLIGPVDINSNARPVVNPTPLSFGGRAGNSGLEGISFDPLTGDVWGVKERRDTVVYRATNIDLSNMTGDVVIQFDAAPLLNGNDLADLYLLSNSLAFAGTDREQNILLLSQEARLLLEVTRSGELVDSMDLTQLGLFDGFEGVTMDDQGILYLATETGHTESFIYMLRAPVPEPGSLALLGLSLPALLRRRMLRK